MNLINNLIRKSKIDLGNQLKNRIKIYLDLNYWINLGRCSDGSSKNSEYQELYELLAELTFKEIVICPISQRIFIELLKQGDYNSRIDTAKTMDKLSQGVALLSEPEREQAELFYYVRKKILGQGSIVPADEFIWLKVAYVLGVFIPENKSIPKDILNEMQKDIFSKSLEVSLEEMISSLGDTIPNAVFNKESATTAINFGKMLANNKIHSIKQVFLDEVRGTLSIYKVTVENFFDYIKSSNLLLLEELYANKVMNPNDMLEKIWNDLNNDSMDKYLPSLYIQLCLHSLMRWDKKRKFRPNDLEDFLHASSALGYYDYLFTEKPLTILLKSGPFNLNKKYRKVVLYDVQEIIKLLTELKS